MNQFFRSLGGLDEIFKTVYKTTFKKHNFSLFSL
jgi:hypothetical protein